MQIPLGRRGAAFAGFFAGFILCAFGGHVMYWAANSMGSDKIEEERVASPDGRYDAVLSMEHFGGFGSHTNWYLYIVARGSRVPWHYAYGANPLLWAGSFSGEKLDWKTPHFLDVHYDLGEIVDFRNLWAWYEALSGWERSPFGKLDYMNGYFVEIRLCPSSSYSVLTPERRLRN